MGHAATDDIALSEDPITDGEQPLLLDLLFDHRAEVIRDFLRERERPVSGTKEQLRERLTGYIADGIVAVLDLVDLLDTVEGWGNQHVYLFRANANAPALQEWADEAKVRAVLRRRGLEHLLNRRRRLLLPATRQLVSIEWSSRRVRFVWVETRLWRERRPDLDRREDSPRRAAHLDQEGLAARALEYDAYEVFRGRGIIAFELDLVSGQAVLLIQQLPSGNDYAAVRETILEELQTMIDVRSFHPVRVGRSIVRLAELDGVRRRQLEHMTARGSRINYVSAERDADAFADPTLEQARRGAGAGVVGRMGNFYWRLPNAEREIHVKVYAPDQRVGFFGECAETEVRNVLRLVRQHSR
jgi:hypothetical protein